MDITKCFVRDGKVVFKDLSPTCGIEDGQPSHVFNKGAKMPCDCGHIKDFDAYDAVSNPTGETAMEGPVNPFPIATKGHLSLYQGGKR